MILLVLVWSAGLLPRHWAGKYQVKYTDESNQDKEIQVDSVAFFLGGLHRPNDVKFAGATPKRAPTLVVHH